MLCTALKLESLPQASAETTSDGSDGRFEAGDVDTLLDVLKKQVLQAIEKHAVQRVLTATDTGTAH